MRNIKIIIKSYVNNDINMHVKANSEKPLLNFKLYSSTKKITIF